MDDYLSYLYDDEFVTIVYEDEEEETIVITFRKSNECWNRYNNEYESGNIRTSSKRPNEFSW